MTDLSVDYAGLKLPSPLLVAAAGISETVELMKRAQDNGAGAIVMKSLFEEEFTRQFPTPCFRVIKRQLGSMRSSTFYSMEQASSWGLDRYCEEIARAKKELDIPIIGSINCVTDEGWISYAKALEAAGADAIELNRSCPYSTQVIGDKDLWSILAAETVKLVKASVSIPIIPKFTPQLANPIATAVMLEQAGADGLCMFSRFTGLEIDVESEKPIMHGGFAGHGGLWAIHYALRWIVATSPQVSIPISASGGVGSTDDVIKYLLVGANNIQVCTAIYMQGFGVLKTLRSGVASFMERKGYQQIDDFRGNACDTVLPMEQVDRRFKVVALIDSDKCNGCGLCERICVFGGPESVGGKFRIGARCRGCGLCSELCPTGAITMARTQPCALV